MTIDLTSIAIEAMASESAKKLYGLLGGVVTSRHKTTTSIVEESLSKHLRFALSWSEQYSFLGLTNPRDSKLSTIPLRLSGTPRRYRRANDSIADAFGEDSILSISNSIVLLGDPGAGKTTTLKRLCLSILSDDKRDGELDYQVPIVVILRDQNDIGSIVPFIAEALSVSVERSDEEGIANRWKTSSGGSAIAHVASILSQMGSLLILDGLDEVSNLSRPYIEKEIEYISRNLSGSNVIVSCRSGDYNRNLGEFSLLEILPLSRNEIVEISSLWLEDSSEFINALDSRPYRDIVDRPLLLSFLIFLFQMEGSLPLKPVQIYRKVVYRLLREWDEERGIERGSSYSSFDVDTKIDFLSEFSYLLTYKLKERGFSEDDALKIIGEISESYDLPGNDSLKILREIETHTGIVTAAGFSRFEFAHLSIQEFLCASYICRSPVPHLLRNYLVEYPAPVAVACALSSQPEVFLNQMLRRHILEKFKNPEDFFQSIDSGDQLVLDIFGQDTGSTLLSFLNRLILENPKFKISREYGESLLILYAFYYRRYNKPIDELINSLSFSPEGSLSLELFFSSANLEGYEVTRRTSCLDFSPMFYAMHWDMTGADSRQHSKWDILPLAMIPSKVLRASKIEIVRSNDIQYPDRAIKKNLSGTQLCDIEFGDHQRRGDTSACDRCGNIPSPKSVRRKSKKGR